MKSGRTTVSGRRARPARGSGRRGSRRPPAGRSRPPRRPRPRDWCLRLRRQRHRWCPSPAAPSRSRHRRRARTGSARGSTSRRRRPSSDRRRRQGPRRRQRPHPRRPPFPHSGGGRRLPGGQPAVQRVRERSGRAPAVLRLERQRPVDDRRELLGYRRSDRPWVRGRAAESSDRHRSGAVALPGPLPGEHLEEHDAQREDVAGLRGRLAARLLGAEVMDGSERRPGQRQRRLGDRPGDAEVRHLDLAVAADDDVPGLHVAVDDPLRVGCRKRPGNRGRDPRGLARRECAIGAQDRREVLTVDELHDDERTAWILAVVVDADDVGVRKRRHGAGLEPEARREIRVAEILGTEQLDGDVAAQLGVGRAVDGRHAALSDQLDQPVAAAHQRSDFRQTSVPRAAPDPSRRVGRHRTAGRPDHPTRA